MKSIEQEVIDVIIEINKKDPNVTFTMIARKINVNVATISDICNRLKRQGVINIDRIGSSNIVSIK